MENLDTETVISLVKLENALNLLGNCSDGLAVKMFKENKDIIIWLAEQSVQQRDEIKRLRAGLNYLIQRASEKPRGRVTLDDIAQEVLQGYDYSEVHRAGNGISLTLVE